MGEFIRSGLRLDRTSLYQPVGGFYVIVFRCKIVHKTHFHFNCTFHNGVSNYHDDVLLFTTCKICRRLVGIKML